MYVVLSENYVLLFVYIIVNFCFCQTYATNHLYMLCLSETNRENCKSYVF